MNCWRTCSLLSNIKPLEGESTLKQFELSSLFQASNSLSHSQHVVIPEYPILGTSELQFHPIKKDVYYRLWNLTTDGLIQKDPNDTAIVPCSGGFSGPDISKNILKLFLNKYGPILLAFCPTTHEIPLTVQYCRSKARYTTPWHNKVNK